ncbi:MAG: stage II sporulation protein M [Halobacteriales archaeon]
MSGEDGAPGTAEDWTPADGVGSDRAYGTERDASAGGSDASADGSDGSLGGSDGPADRDGSGSGGNLLARLRRLAGATRFRRWFRLHLALAVALFVLGLAPGLLLGAALPPADGAGVGTLPASPVLPGEFTTEAIFLNNILAMTVNAAGVVTLGVLSALSLLVNGFIVGLVLALAGETIGWGVAVALVAPHGVLELPAFFATSAVAFRINHRAVRWLLGRDGEPLTRVELFEVGVIAATVVLLLVVAAWIEVHVTADFGRYVVR